MKWQRAIELMITVLIGAMVIASSACGGPDGSGEGSPADELDRTGTNVFAGYVRSPLTDVSEVVLPDAEGQQVSMIAKNGGLRLVFFGYTTCPDVCPATLGYVKMAMGALSQTDRNRLDVDMITVDPSRDDADTLRRYVEQFVPTANAIRTDDDELLRSAAEAFGASYEVSTDHAGQARVSHTGDLYAVDDMGRVVLAWPFGSSPTDIENDLTRLLEGERPTAEPMTNQTREGSGGSGK